MFIFFKQQYKIYFESLALFSSVNTEIQFKGERVEEGDGSSVNTEIQFKGERVEKGDGCVEFFLFFY